ncbi:P-loop containing nucleoside triphosphate hydrolase protein [Macroventuria anomochaeta]|uniref:P-loop containing nucleoside triphosphate hydrolase protein n=1 Tax=Macroventuria anomochaeta TaxID=301207 RepID=A0ACB6RSH6_9PLEO|nr:P-loop containing nucleoside triphosphate hydrolase protein [Macroventuria anomochaeta]KAF2624866.1 P-loop containing nucleoside triphosphate hydrolase protein [Macroventuria anomochaeta]
MMARKDEQESPSMIVVMGVTGAGKSYFVNQLAGKEVAQEGPDLDPCTQECQGIPVTIGNSKVLLIDTPGFDDTNRTDSEILTEIARILSAQYELGVQLKGVIYIHRITDVRYSRAAIKTFEIFKKMCGQDALKNVLLITSRWDGIDPSLGAERERQLKDKFWAYMVGHGSNISRFHGDRPSAVSLVSQLLSRDDVVLQLQRELVDEGKDLNATVAGAYVEDNLDKLKQQVQDELASLERLKRDLLENDRAMRRQVRLDWEQESARLKALQNQQVSLQRPVGTEVRQEIKQKRSGLSKVMPYVPVTISILAAFMGIPPGVTEMFTGWFADLGSSGDPSS